MYLDSRQMSSANDTHLLNFTSKVGIYPFLFCFVLCDGGGGGDYSRLLNKLTVKDKGKVVPMLK